MIFLTIFCTSGATKIAVGNATKKPIANDFIQRKMKLMSRPVLMAVKTPDIIKAMMRAIKNGNNMRGFFNNFFIILIFFNREDCYFHRKRLSQ